MWFLFISSLNRVTLWWEKVPIWGLINIILISDKRIFPLDLWWKRSIFKTEFIHMIICFTISSSRTNGYLVFYWSMWNWRRLHLLNLNWLNYLYVIISEMNSPRRKAFLVINLYILCLNMCWAKSFFRLILFIHFFISIAYVMDILSGRKMNILIWVCCPSKFHFTSLSSFPELFLVCILNIWVYSNLYFTVVLVVQVTLAFMKSILVGCMFISWLYSQHISLFFALIAFRWSH